VQNKCHASVAAVQDATKWLAFHATWGSPNQTSVSPHHRIPYHYLESAAVVLHLIIMCSISNSPHSSLKRVWFCGSDLPVNEELSILKLWASVIQISLGMRSTNLISTTLSMTTYFTRMIQCWLSQITLAYWGTVFLDDSIILLLLHYCFPGSTRKFLWSFDDNTGQNCAQPQATHWVSSAMLCWTASMHKMEKPWNSLQVCEVEGWDHWAHQAPGFSEP
jgi:hypothetical protein